MIDNLGRTLTGLGGYPNPNYAILRTWENAVNSNYNALQVSVKKQMSQIRHQLVQCQLHLEPLH